MEVHHVYINRFVENGRLFLWNSKNTKERHTSLKRCFECKHDLAEKATK